MDFGKYGEMQHLEISLLEFEGAEHPRQDIENGRAGSERELGKVLNHWSSRAKRPRLCKILHESKNDELSIQPSFEVPL